VICNSILKTGGIGRRIWYNIILYYIGFIMPNSQVIAECNKLVDILNSEDYSIFSRKYKIDGDQINILYTARMFITSDNASDNTDHIKVLCGYITELSDILFRMNALAPDYHARLRAIYNRLHHYVTVNDQAPYHPILASTKVWVV